MTDEERLATRKEFRKYLRTQEGITGADLDAVIRAAEQHVPAFVRERFLPEFTGVTGNEKYNKIGNEATA